MARRQCAILLLTLALAACGAPPGASMPSGSASPAMTDSPSAAPTLRASLAEPGRPYDGHAVLQAMRDSPRPGGVPDELETDEIAAAVARELWTWGGQAWPSMQIGGSCGPASCSLEVGGSPRGAAGSDLYVLRVDLASSAVSVDNIDLHGYPAALDRDLKAACSANAPNAVAGLAFTSARWIPPPDAGRFWVAYRSGGEEGSRGVDLLVDLATGELLDRRRT
jgi:hypothetical protein